MSASGKPGWDTMFAPQVPGFPRATINDLASVERIIGPRTVAVMLEPVQGESGVVPATVEFLRALRALTRRHRCLMIVDEVQTGIGRTGRLFGYQHYARGTDEAPDVMLAPGFLDGVAARGRYLGAGLEDLVTTCGLSHERGWGLLRALDLGKDVAGAVVAYARDSLEKHEGWDGQGLLLNAPRPNLLRFMPALDVTEAEIDRMLNGVRIALEAVG
jgi:acetylornithine/N-succinyldiaminopimelate aminotransferase